MPGEADWAALLTDRSHGSPQFELQLASSGQTFLGGVPRGVSSPGHCLAVSLTGGNGDSGTCYRWCWQLNTSRTGPCHILIMSGTLLQRHAGQRGFKWVTCMLAQQQIGLIEWSENVPSEVSLSAALSPAGYLQLLASA